MNPIIPFFTARLWLLILILMWINDSLLHGQKEATPAFFAYAQSEKSALNLSIGSIDRASYGSAKITIQKILDDLVAARGDKRQPIPQLTMNGEERYVAWMNPKKVEIGMEAKAYAICQSFGKDSLNALAALLGHELIHYYDKHNWTRHFAKEHQQLDAAQQLQQMKEGLKNETQADYLGGFLGYSAGYNTLGIMPKVLEKVYQEYGLPNAIKGYPSLEERQTIAQQSMEKLEQLAKAFDMANFLLALEDYQSAHAYYQFILKDFQSREIYNNLGVTRFLEALTYFDKKEVPFAFPIELDAQSRLKSTTRNIGFADRITVRNSLLEKAIQHFDFAIAMDKDYVPAYLNMACAYTLLEDVDEVAYWLRKAQKLAKQTQHKKATADIFILQGILAYMAEDIAASKANFDKAIKLGSSLAQNNRMLLEGKPMATPMITNFKLGGQTPTIDNVKLEDFLENLEIDVSTNINKQLLFASKRLDNSTIYVNYVNQGADYLLLHWTDENYASHQSNWVGQSLYTIEEKLGKMSRSIETPQ